MSVNTGYYQSSIRVLRGLSPKRRNLRLGSLPPQSLRRKLSIRRQQSVIQSKCVPGTGLPALGFSIALRKPRGLVSQSLRPLLLVASVRSPLAANVGICQTWKRMVAPSGRRTFFTSTESPR